MLFIQNCNKTVINRIITVNKGVHYMGKKAKNDQLLIKINKEVKKEFIRICEADDTTASRELRKYIERFIDEHNKEKA